MSEAVRKRGLAPGCCVSGLDLGQDPGCLSPFPDSLSGQETFEEVSDLPIEDDRVNRELDDFACIASHDLKEPLRGIRTYCELLAEDYGDKLDLEGGRRLHALIDMCDRLAALVDSLLAYCRVGQVRPPDEQVDLNAVLREVLETFRLAMERRNAEVRVHGPLPCARGDATLIGLVFGNLISNGLKFNESERPRLEVGSLPADLPTFYVRDNGVGIDAKHHQAVFALFRRLHSRKRFDGTGAGLTIVRRIVEAHGGKVWLESVPGRGTTFYFTLGPAAKATPSQPPHWIGRSAGSTASLQPVR